MIPQRNLSLLSNRLARKGGRRIPEIILERDYCLSWFLAGLSKTPLKDILLFKGGTAIKKCYFFDYRFSEDMDFTLAKEISLEDILKQLEIVYDYIYKTSGIKFYFSRQDRHNHANTYTFFIGYEGPLPAASNKGVKIDITLQEKIVFPIMHKKVLQGYDEYQDIPDNAIISVYSLQEISSEKVIALLDRARNEPRDLYDIWYLIHNKHISLLELTGAVEQKIEFRGEKLAGVLKEFPLKEQRLKKLWETRLFSQMSLLPEFEDIYRTVKREFRQAGLLIRT
ncbi:MAG: nucleotidyl transferase AbiEii/AbiGii toxin family protein [bacterium]